MTTTTASAVMTAAHKTAKLMDVVVAYKVRLSSALKSAWAAAKQTITTITTAIMETIYVADPHVLAGASTSQARTYTVYHMAGTAAFVTVQREAAGAPARQQLVSTSRFVAGGPKAFELNGQVFYTCLDFAAWSDVDASDAAALGCTMEDVATATAALNA